MPSDIGSIRRQRDRMSRAVFMSLIVPILFFIGDNNSFGVFLLAYMVNLIVLINVAA